jgi:beta-galactosidase
MVEITDRRFIIDGKPRLVISGEVQYFRLRRSEWSERIRQAKEGGLNAISSYIPWIFHEEIEGEIDVSGRKSPEHDVAAFIDLCHEQGLWFLARPGPYQMGELKNEGLPYWIFTKYPDALSETWGGKRATGKNVDYLHPGFLESARKWYAGIMPVLARRLQQNGGNVVGVQLDNEIGMLMCWNEQAVLNEAVQCGVAALAQLKHGADEANAKYGFNLADPVVRRKMFWQGDFPGALAFHTDYVDFMRDRFAQYIAKLRSFAEENGVRDIPFIVNIQGTGGGKARTYGLGISETMRCFNQAPGYLPSSDQYLNELTRENVTDLYMLNAITACVSRPEQPLSSIEFQAGTGDYAGNGTERMSGAAADFKVRLCLVQGNRMLSHYTFTAGVNPKLEKPHGDGNDTIGTGGDQHDPTSAPIKIGGTLDPIYFTTGETNRTMLVVGDLLADMDEELDGVRLGFIPDYYSTDVKPPGPMRELAAKLESTREGIETLMRPLLDRSFAFTAVNLQAPIPSDCQSIVLSCAVCLQREVQDRLLTFVDGGGTLFLLGRLPTEDLEGNASTLLIDRLGIRPGLVINAEKRYLAIQGSGWAKHEPSQVTWQLETFASSGKPFLNVVGSGEVCGATHQYGKGKVLVITCEPPSSRSFWDGVFGELGLRPRLSHDYPFGGIVLSRVRNRRGGRFVSLLNLDLLDKELTIRDEGAVLFGGKIMLPGKKAKMLPINLEIGGLRIDWSSAEVTEVSRQGVSFRQSPAVERASFAGPVRVGSGARVTARDGLSTQIEIEPGFGRVFISPA